VRLRLPPGAEGRSAAAGAVGLAGAGVVGTAMAWSLATGAGGILGQRWGMLARLAVWALAWAVGVAAAFRLPARLSVGAVIAVGLVLRAASLAGPPATSDDLYRYAWDGRVQAAGVDPYRHPPGSSALSPLREPWLWPDAEGCASIGKAQGCSRINRPQVRTIYPPLAERWFAAVYSAAGVGARHKAWQAAGLATEAALLLLLPVCLRRLRRDPRWTALYALAPLPAFEVVNNGHVDGLAALIIVAALTAAAGRRAAATGAVLGAAALVKLYPAVLVVGAAGRRWGRAASIGVAGAAAAVVVVAGYLPHVLSVGVRVLGYLPGYLREEGYDSGGRFLLLGLLGLSGDAAALAAAVLLAAVVAAVAWARRPVDPARAVAVVMGAMLLVATPVQPWYAVVLLAVAAAAAEPRWAVLAIACYPYFFAVILDAPHAVAIGRLSYLAGCVPLVLARLDAARDSRLAAILVPDGDEDDEKGEEPDGVQGDPLGRGRPCHPKPDAVDREKHERNGEEIEERVPSPLAEPPEVKGGDKREGGNEPREQVPHRSSPTKP
jgi:Glycosyltransferase family 87